LALASLVLAELALPALRTEDVLLAESVRAGAPLVVRVLVLAPLAAALGAGSSSSGDTGR
jgi:hypothetical protein